MLLLQALDKCTIYFKRFILSQHLNITASHLKMGEVKLHSLFHKQIFVKNPDI